MSFHVLHPIPYLLVSFLFQAFPLGAFSKDILEEELSIRRDDFLSNVRQVTFEGKRSGEGYFSPDGARMVFQSERDSSNPFYQIFLMDLTTGSTEKISTGIGKTTCGWIRPDGTVLYASTHADSESERKQKEELDVRARGKSRRYQWDYDEKFDLYLLDLEKSIPRRLTWALGYDAEGSSSPDGSRFASVCASTRSRSSASELFEINSRRKISFCE